MVSGIQLLGIFFALVLGYFTFLNFKRREFTLREFLGWELLWVGFGVASIFPSDFKIFSGHFGTFRPLDFFVIIGFIVVLSISFYTYVYVDRLRKHMEQVVRDLALSEHSDLQKKSNKQ